MAPGQNQRRQDRRDKKDRDQAVATPAPPPPPPASTTAAPAPASTTESSAHITSTIITKAARPTKSVTETLTLTPTPTASPAAAAKDHSVSHGSDKSPSYALIVAVPLLCVLFLSMAIVGLVIFRRKNGERRRRARDSTSTTESEEEYQRRSRSRRYKKEPKRISSKSTLGSTTLGSHLGYSPKQPTLPEERAFGTDATHSSPIHGMEQLRPMSGASSLYPEDYHHHISQINQGRISELGTSHTPQPQVEAQVQAPAPVPPERSLAREYGSRSPNAHQGPHELQVPFGGMLPMNRAYSPPTSPPPQGPPPRLPGPQRPLRPDQDDPDGKWLPAPLRVARRGDGAGNNAAF
jgi:hypothetical protein